MTLEERIDVMCNRYGEAVSKSKAAHIIDRCPSTINEMLKDGRLESSCEGTRVDVESLARYINSPAKIDSETRLHKRGGSPKWHV